MSKKLDTVLDNYIATQYEKVLQIDIKEDQREFFVNTIKKTLKEEIYNEIKAEVKDKAVLEAQHEIEEKAGLMRIREFKKLMFDGFVVAIFVGLFVNQTTDIIGYCKGSITLNSVWSTVILAVVFLLICCGIFLWRFISELINLLTKGKNDEED